MKLLDNRILLKYSVNLIYHFLQVQDGEKLKYRE